MSPQPLAVAQAALVRVTLTDADSHQPISGAAIDIEGRMTHPGMAPVIEPAAEESAGVYRASLTWSMAGDWVLFANGHGPAGERIRLQLASVRVEPR